jgi:hypothetical protein
MATPKLMETLRHENSHAHTSLMIIDPHQFFFLSPFDINGKGYLPLGMLPLSKFLLSFFVFLSL